MSSTNWLAAAGRRSAAATARGPGRRAKAGRDCGRGGGGGARVSGGVAEYRAEGLERRVMLSAGLGFGAQQTFATGAGPYSVATADVNGDGKTDLVTANVYGASLSVLLGNGNGTFGTAHSFAVGAYPSSVAVSDLNGDGKPDLIAAYSGSSVSVLIGSGTGTFGAAQLVLSHTGAIFVAASDVNGDGRADLAVVNNTGAIGSNVSVLLGLGNGAFQIQKTFATGASPFSVAPSDVNGDGKPDLLVANDGDNNVAVMIGNGNGSFHALAAVPAGAGPESAATADMNGDGKADLVVGNYAGGTVSVALGNGNGTFKAQHTFDAGTTPRSVVTADFNGDGKPDVVVADYYVGTASVLVGVGDGTLEARRSFAVGSQPWSVAAADVNRDGRPDVVVANRASNTVSVLPGAQPPNVLSINRANPAGPGTVDGSVNYLVTFSGPVTGVDYSDFALAKTGTVNATNFFIVAGGPTAYVVTVYNITGTGTLGLNLVADGSIQDAAGLAVESGVDSLQTQQTSAVGQNPTSMASSDLNGDGKSDLIVVNKGVAAAPGTVGTLLGNGNGTFQSQQTFVTGTLPVSLAISDLNRDGSPDVVVANSGSNTVSVLLGNGDGTLQAQRTFVTGTNPMSVAVSDVNGDGKPDVAVANRAGNTVGVLLANGDGTFKPQLTFATGKYPVCVAVSDLNGDGRPDLVVTYQGVSYLLQEVSVLLGNGNGTFQAQLTSSAGTDPISIAVADLNGDGKPDLAIGSPSVNYYTGNFVTILLGNGDGTFRSAGNLSAGAGPSAVSVADMNGDGKPDVVVADSGWVNFNYSYSGVIVLPGNGDGTFQPARSYFTGLGTTTTVAADVNGDGKTDVIVANLDGTVKALTATPATGFTAPGQTYTIVPPDDLITGNGANNTITLTKTTGGTDIEWVMGAARGLLPVGDPNGLTVNGNGGTDTIALNYANGNPLPNTMHLNGRFQINGLQGTDPLAGTTLDVQRSMVYLNNGGVGQDPIVRIKAYLAAGYNGGAWNGTPGGGTGIITSADARNNIQHDTGVGYIDSADGTGLNPAVNSILLRYTVIGDTDLDGTVGLSDYTAVVRNFGSGTGWDRGVVTYGTSVGLGDYTAVVRNFGKSVPAVPAVVAAEAAEAVTASASSPVVTPRPVPAFAVVTATETGGKRLAAITTVKRPRNEPGRNGRERGTEKHR